MPKFYADVDIEASSLKIESATALEPTIEILSTANSTYGGVLKFNKQQIDNTPSDSDAIGWISFAGEDALGAENFYGSIICTTAEVDAGDEAGQIQISVANNGVSRNGITMTGDKDTAEEVDVTIANGAASTTTIAGDLTVTTKITECKRKFSPTGSNTAGANSGGDIVYIGSGGTVLGEIVHYTSSGTWEAADATDVTKCDGLLGVALGDDPDVDGVLLRGMVTIADIDGTEAVGMPLFLSEDATGHANMDAPEGNTNIVRIIGYCLHATNGEIWFNPDNTFVEVTA